MKDKLSDIQYSVDHLKRLKERNSAAGSYPDTGDTQIIFSDQIIPVKEVWDWNVKQNA